MTKEEIKMDYDFNDWLIKVNPIPFKIKSKGLFVIVGKGKVKYFDKQGDGFEGNSFIVGLEFFFIRKYVTFGLGMKRYGIKFDNSSAFNIPPESEATASDYQIHANISLGIGI